MAVEDLPLYLGPQLPRWSPRTPDDVQRAIDEGDLAERRWVDVKLVQNFTDSAKKELARDLASLANDGGVLIFGVAEDKPTGTLTVTPIPLDGLRERFEQIAQDRLDPPLFITTRPLTASPGDTLGLMLIEVPTSALAPHQVKTDGAYYGRGDTTKHKLSDDEIRRLHDRRSARRATAIQLYERASRLEQSYSTDHACVFVVAAPLASPPDLLTEQLGEPNDLLLPVRERWREVPLADRIGLTFEYLRTAVPTPSGVAIRSTEYASGFAASDGSAMTLEIHDDGTVEFYCGGASKGAGGDGLPRGEWLFPERVLVWTESTLRTATHLAADRGYHGPWMLMLSVTRLGGMGDWAHASFDERPFWPRTDDPYIESTEAWTVEILEQPQQVCRRLARRLLRGLGTTSMYEPFFSRG